MNFLLNLRALSVFLSLQAQCIATAKFIAHLVNQHVLYELVALELLTLLLDQPTDDSVEVAVGFVKVCRWWDLIRYEIVGFIKVCKWWALSRYLGGGLH